MEPGEVDPLTFLNGPGATLRDVVCSACTFFLWEQLYGVAGVSPIPSRILLYHMQHEQNEKKTSVPIIEHCRNSLHTNGSSEESRKNDFRIDVSLTTESTGVNNARSDRYKPSSPTHERAPQTHRKHGFGIGDPFILGDVYRKWQQNSEAKNDISCVNETNTTKDRSDGNHIFQIDNTGSSPPPPFGFLEPTAVCSKAEVCLSSRDGDVLFSESSYRTLAEDLTFVFSSEHDKWMDTKNRRSEEVEDTADENGLCSEPSVVLNLGGSYEGRSFASAHHIASGSSSDSKAHYPVPDPTRLTGAPVSHHLQWETPGEAQSLVDSKVVCGEIGGDESLGMDKHPEKFWGGGSEEEELNITKEDFSVFSAGKRDYFPVDRSPSSVFLKSRSFSTSPLHPRQMFCSETPPRRNIDEYEVKVLPSTRSTTEEAPKGRVRRYNPPSFSCTGPCEGVRVLTGMHGQSHSAWANKDTASSAVLESQNIECVLKNTSDISLDQHSQRLTPVSKCHPPPPPPPLELGRPISEELFFSPGRSVSALKSPETDMENEVLVSKRSTSTIREENSDVIRKSVSTSLGAANVNHLGSQEKLGELKSMGETREAVLSVSPSPSYKDYEWAKKAQEELEQQQKRRVACTPSTGSLSPPPPLKVGGFEQPQPPKGRSAMQRDVVEQRGENKKVPGATATEGKQEESHTLLEGLLTSVSNIPISESKQYCTQGITLAEDSVERKRGRPKVEEAASVSKRARRGTVSPPTVVEFPLPRDMAVDTTGKEKSMKRGSKKGKK